MADSVSIEVKGFDNALAVIDKLGYVSFDPLLRLMGNIVQEQTINHFTEGGGPDGPWAPLKSGAPSYLTAFGILKGSIGYVVGDMKVNVGTNIGYGIFHQEGTKYMPQRRFLGLNESDMGGLRAAIEGYISDLLLGDAVMNAP